jgi:hypothetical protein
VGKVTRKPKPDEWRTTSQQRQREPLRRKTHHRLTSASGLLLTLSDYKARIAKVPVRTDIP